MFPFGKVVHRFDDAFNPPIEIMKLKTFKGLALQDILTEVHLYVHRGQLTMILSISSSTLLIL